MHTFFIQPVFNNRKRVLLIVVYQFYHFQPAMEGVVCAERRASKIVFWLQRQLQTWKTVAKTFPDALRVVLKQLEDEEDKTFEEFNTYRTIAYMTDQGFTCANQLKYEEVKQIKKDVCKYKMLVKSLPAALQIVYDDLEEAEAKSHQEYLLRCFPCSCCD